MSDTTDPNSLYDKGDTVFVMISAAMVFLMVPGIGMFYSGMSRKKHALSLLWCSLIALSVTAIQWYLIGYSLAFSHNVKSGFIGSLELGGYHNMQYWGKPSVVSTLPDILFSSFQLQFAAVTVMIMLGGAAERARLGPLIIFVFIWLTVVYCPIACWYWNPEGWLCKLGCLDFAGGGPVHQSSGVAALAYAFALGKRHDPLTSKGVPKYKPHSVSSVVLGIVFIWFAWFGFNPGSAGNATIRAWLSWASTNLAAAVCAFTYMMVDFLRYGKFTTLGLCVGALIGLVCITPMAGFTPVWAAFTCMVAAVICNFAMDLKHLMGIDDGLDVFTSHAVGGLIGAVLTGLFATNNISITGEAEIPGGWLDGNFKQLGYQIAGCCAVWLWSGVLTYGILIGMNKIPFLQIRLSEEEEEMGTDAAQIGEFTYEEGTMFIPQPVRSKKSVEQPEPMNPIDDHIDSSNSSENAVEKVV